MGETFWQRREQHRRKKPAQAQRWAELEESEEDNVVRRKVKEIEDRCKRMIANQSWDIEMKTRRATEAIVKEQEKERNERKSEHEALVEELRQQRAEAAVMREQMTQLIAMVAALGQGQQNAQVQSGQMSRQEVLTPPGDGSTTPVARPSVMQEISDEEATAGIEEGTAPMKTGEAVRRVMEEADSEERITGHRSKKCKAAETAGGASDDA